MEKIDVILADGRINWKCLAADCPQTCCGPFEPIAPSLQSIVVKCNHDDIILTPDDISALRGKINGNIVSKGANYFLKLTEDGSCSLLKNNLCSIHQSKPMLCRAYPFMFDSFKGLCFDISCPGIGKGYTDFSELETQLRALLKLHALFTKQSLDALMER